MCLGTPGIWWRESGEAVTEEGEGAADLFLKGEAGGEGTVGPVFEKRRQEKKGNAATQDCNMAAVVFLSQTAVTLTKRSSSLPRGARSDSPNLSAALLDLVTCDRPGLHSVAVVMFIYMLYSYKAMMLLSVFQTCPLCIYLRSI